MDTVTLTSITDQLLENYGDRDLQGAVVVFWNTDNTVTAAYAGNPLPPSGVVDLALSGTRAMLQQLNPPPAEEPSVKLVESEE